MSTLAQKLDALERNTFYPSREEDIYVESHSGPMNSRYFTVWAHGMPHAVSLSDPSEAAEAFEDATQRFARR